MAQGILFGIAEEILLKLGSQALSELGTCWGVNDEIDNLKDTVSTIKAVLRDAEEQPAQSHEAKDWIARLKDAFYDVDDLMDDFSTEAKRREDIKCNKVAKEVGLFFSHSNQLVYDLKMGHRIKAIREKLEAISKDRRDFHSVSHQAPPPSTNLITGRDQTSSSEIKEEVFGRENDKMEIIGRLLDSDPTENVLAVPIVGLGGLGKTALAQLVYNDDQVKSTFNLRMWVSVSDASDVFDVKLIVAKIIKSATNREPTELDSDSTVPDKKGAPFNLFAGSRVAKSLDLEQLQVLMRKEIEGKKYLLVLDDVWNVDVGKWSSLKDLLSCGGRGSRIIVTTRFERIAKIVSPVPPHMLKGLPIEEAWSLFLQVVFNGQEPHNEAVKEVGKKIMEQCGGVPLAIRSIGGLLYPTNPETEWSSFLEEEFSTIGEEQKEIMSTLRLSYNHLPSQLRHCFAYCALLPKDKEIHVQALIRLWIAEGSIRSSNPNQSLEDIGLRCFRELLRRSFFQEVGYDEFGNEHTFRMHGFMHDLAGLVARTEIYATGSDTGPVDSKTRHLSLHLTSDSIPTHLLKAKRLRTLFLMAGGVDGSQKDSMVGDVCRTYRYLRALDVRQSGIEKVPSSVRKLKHIRYLDLSGNDFILLPESITKLRNLEVLKLSNCKYLLALPKKISKLASLKHLDIEGCYLLLFMPRGLGKLTSLQTLNYFVVDLTSYFTDWVAQETGLKKCLASCYSRSFVACYALAADGWRFRDFFLRRFDNPRHVGGLNELRGLNNLRGELKITNLGAVKHGVSEFQAANLKEKQHLQSLVLIWNRKDFNEDTETSIMDGDSMERSFEYLEPHPNLKKLEVCEYEGGRFPSWLQNLTSLQQLKLRDCPRLASLPEEIYGITSLQKLEISGCDGLNERCMHNKAVDWHIIAHIPNIIVDGQAIQRDGKCLLKDEGSSTATADAEVKEEQTKSEVP